MRSRVVPELDAEEFLHWEDRQAEKYELHHGFVVAFAGGALDNDTIAFNGRKALERAFPSPCRTFGSDVKLRVSEKIVFYPDASVLYEDVPGDATSISAPVVVCEVLSESTRPYDLIDKRAAYRGIASLHAYLVVDTRRRRIEIDTRIVGTQWRTVAVEDGTFELASTSISLDEIYDGTTISSA